MQTQRPDNRDAPNTAVPIREPEKENFEILIRGIWSRITEEHIERRGSRSEYQFDASTNP
jgi:hypothetical protein